MSEPDEDLPGNITESLLQLLTAIWMDKGYPRILAQA
jgi:hypothetical protein